jgi:hypothetical protein
MLKIEKFVTMSPEQWEIVIEGMRNPMNSWDKSDSYYTFMEDVESHDIVPFEFFVGDNDQKLMESLAKGGPVHAKYRRMMPVWATIVAPLYWWKEFDTYKVGTVTNSCSTMHKIHAKEFTLDDFSKEHLIDDIHECWAENLEAGPECRSTPLDILEDVVFALNQYRTAYLRASEALKTRPLTEAERKHILAQRKYYWWQMIQLLPTSYNQKRTVFVPYEVLHNMRMSRPNHKLDEWHIFCDWIDELPYSEIINMEFEDGASGEE